ncbi:MAG: hypothetical protein ABEI58_02675 [Candidatus Nanohaloarchaea archaeon]
MKKLVVAALALALVFSVAAQKDQQIGDSPISGGDDTQDQPQQTGDTQETGNHTAGPGIGQKIKNGIHDFLVSVIVDALRTVLPV